MHDNDRTWTPVTVGMVVYPGFTQLDLAGPYEVFARMPETRVTLVAASVEPSRSDMGLAIVPDTGFADAPPLDIVFVPGGPGQQKAMEEERLIGFLRERGASARYVTSVCTGSLLLGAAGLLRGYRATTHWLSLDLLPLFGAEPVGERVVVDRDRVTGAGVTAGIDFGLVLAAELRGEEVARRIQLLIEYDPTPPFDSGSPESADPALVREISASCSTLQKERRKQIESAVLKAGGAT